MDDEFALCWNNFQVGFKSVGFFSRKKNTTYFVVLKFNFSLFLRTHTFRRNFSWSSMFHFCNANNSTFLDQFQENIASGFQNLFDRGDLVDVTLACDGKLLQAHKIVLAICSPYFQEMFITNPCRHPISEYFILFYWIDSSLKVD